MTTTVYPRVGGGTRCRFPFPFRTQGLSPRWRGNRVELDQRTVRERSIPALAGEPSICSSG